MKRFRILLLLSFAALVAAEEPQRVLIPASELGMPRRRSANAMAEALTRENVSRFEARIHEDGADGRLPYRLFIPQIVPGRSYPLVLALHGAGGRGDDNLTQITGGNALVSGRWTLPETQAQHPCFVLAPQCPSDPAKWADVQWGKASHQLPTRPTDPMRLALDLVERLLREQPIDPGRLYVCGQSMGGYGAWDVLSRQPDRWAAAIIVCGGLADDQASRVAPIPVWMFHGTRDGVVKPIRSERAFEELTAVGGRPRLTLYEGLGHPAWNISFSEPKIVDWLFSKRRQ